MNNGVPCGNSWISSDKTCRVGEGSAASYTGLSSFGSQSAEVTAAVARYDEAVQRNLAPEAHSMWRRAAQDSIDRHIAETSKGTPSMPTHLAKQLEKGESMMTNQPTTLDLGDGITLAAPPGMQPYFAWVQTGFSDPVVGVSVNTPDANGLSSYKKQSGGANWTLVHLRGEMQDIKAFKEAQEASNGNWPLNSSDRQPVSKAEVDKVLASGSGKLWYSGGNTMDPNGRPDIAFYYGAAKQEAGINYDARRERKEREIVTSWLSFGGRDPVTGKSIPLPDQPGSTVDHLRPYSKFLKEAKGNNDVAQPKADKADNFLITKGGPQGLRRDVDWDKFVKSRNADPDAWAQGRAAEAKENPRVMSLSRSQFQQRYPGQDFNSPAAREAAARDYQVGFLTRIGGGSIPQARPSAADVKLNKAITRQEKYLGDTRARIVKATPGTSQHANAVAKEAEQQVTLGRLEAERSKRSSASPTPVAKAGVSSVPAPPVVTAPRATQTRAPAATPRTKTVAAPVPKKPVGMTNWSRPRLTKALEQAVDQGDDAKVATIRGILGGLG